MIDIDRMDRRSHGETKLGKGKKSSRTLSEHSKVQNCFSAESSIAEFRIAIGIMCDSVAFIQLCSSESW